MSSTQHWQEVYQHRQPDALTWFQEAPILSLQMISDCSLDKDIAIIDVGGGTSRLAHQLVSQGYRDLTVLDLSQKALDINRTTVPENQNKIHWLQEDITQFKNNQKYGLWHDRAVFHFLTEDSDREKYLATLKCHLQPKGFLIIATFAIGGPEKCSGLPVVQYDKDKMSQELGPDFRLVDTQQETHLTPLQNTQAFSYFRFQFLPE